MVLETSFGKQNDLLFMKQALKLAQTAASLGEVPVGAVVINKEGNIIGQGYNMVESHYTQAAHAEIIAINNAGKTIQDWRLKDCWLYVTLEPCSVCIELIKASRIAGIVYGAHSPLFGFQLDKPANFWVYKRDTFSIVEGVMQKEASELLKKFFQKKRNVNERKTGSTKN